MGHAGPNAAPGQQLELESQWSCIHGATLAPMASAGQRLLSTSYLTLSTYLALLPHCAHSKGLLVTATESSGGVPSPFWFPLDPLAPDATWPTHVP